MARKGPADAHDAGRGALKSAGEGASPIILLMIEILHDLIYQNSMNYGA